jgi:hypothetical protein
LAVDRTVVHSAPCSRETAQEKRWKLVNCLLYIVVYNMKFLSFILRIV